MRSAEEAVAYARALHALVRWIGICDGNMQEARSAATPTSRCGDRARQSHSLRNQNLNSFRFLEHAIEFEASARSKFSRTAEKSCRRRGFTIRSGRDRSMRTKEEAHDYRYFPIRICSRLR